MTPAHATLTRWSNALGVWLYRHSGRHIGPARGTTIGLLSMPLPSRRHGSCTTAGLPATRRHAPETASLGPTRRLWAGTLPSRTAAGTGMAFPAFSEPVRGTTFESGSI